MTKALQDIVVLDLSQVYQGPYCSLLMAYQGAKVIKIEPLGGEVLRQRDENENPHEFLMFNSNKLGITLNLKSEEGKTIFRELVKQADVIVENYTPGVMDRLGLGYSKLKEINPRIIYASASGYGLEGPYSSFPGMDLTVQAMSGVLSSTGFEEGLPVKAGPALVDILGGIHLFGGISTALYQREKTGKGQLVEVSMHDTVYPALASALGAYYDGYHEAPERTGNRHSGLRMAPYNVYPTADGNIAIICVAERHWNGLATEMGREDLIGAQGFEDTVSRAKNMVELDNIIEQWTKGKKKWELIERLQRAHVPCAPVLTVKEVAEDPHLRYRGMIREVIHPVVGKRFVPGSPIRLSESQLNEVTASPSIGEHTEQIFMSMLGMKQQEIHELKQQNII